MMLCHLSPVGLELHALFSSLFPPSCSLSLCCLAYESQATAAHCPLCSCEATVAHTLLLSFISLIWSISAIQHSSTLQSHLICQWLSGLTPVILLHLPTPLYILGFEHHLVILHYILPFPELTCGLSSMYTPSHPCLDTHLARQNRLLNSQPWRIESQMLQLKDMAHMYQRHILLLHLESDQRWAFWPLGASWDLPSKLGHHPSAQPDLQWQGIQLTRWQGHIQCIWYWCTWWPIQAGYPGH